MVTCVKNLFVKKYVFILATTLFFFISLPNLLFSTDFNYNVGVYYYPWYYNDFHGGQYLRKHLVPAQSPVLGEYNDRTQPVITQHLDWCRYAGIDFWVASWWGPGGREDVTLLNTIFQNPDLGNFKIALFYESTGRTSDFTDYSNLSSDIAYIADNYFNKPNYYKINGKPVLFIYLTRVFSSYGTLSSSLVTMRNSASAKGYQMYIVGDQAFGNPGGLGQVALLDAITNYDVYGSMGATGYAGQVKVDSYFSQQSGWRELAHSVGKDFIPSVSPGFNDKGVRTGHSPLSRKLSSSSEFGSLFQAELQQARIYTDTTLNRMMMVTSWNEWHEDTQIEPVESAPATTIDDSSTGNYYTNGLPYEGYDDRYLRILREETYPTGIQPKFRFNE